MNGTVTHLCGGAQPAAFRNCVATRGCVPAVRMAQARSEVPPQAQSGAPLQAPRPAGRAAWLLAAVLAWLAVSCGDDAPAIDADVSDDADDAVEPAPWRSALFPEDWSPDHELEPGVFLHDFSWAGYRHGEPPPDSGELEVFPVEGVATDGGEDATAAIQAAIDAASVAGGVVLLPTGTLRVDDLLTVSASGVVLRGQGSAQTRLWFTRSSGMANRAHLTMRGTLQHGAHLPLIADAPSRGHVVELEPDAPVEVGDTVALGWVITPAFIEQHAMTGIWQAFNDSWQPFMRRQVTGVTHEAARTVVELDVPLRSDALLRDAASLRIETGHLREVGVEALAVANATDWEAAWAHNQTHAITLDGVVDAWVRDVASFPSPGAPAEGPGAGDHLQSSGLMVRHAHRVTVADSTLERAQNRGPGGNGYLFEVRQSSEVLFVDCAAAHGRHNFIQNWGFGATGVVWLRVHTAGGRSFPNRDSSLATVGASEFHHSLATANLIDGAVIDDAWAAQNRKLYSTGAGHSATESVFWNASGEGTITSFQWGMGYVIGTAPSLTVTTDMPANITPEQRPAWESVGGWTSTWPEDWREGIGAGALLEPSSLYESQRALRLARQ